MSEHQSKERLQQLSALVGGLAHEIKNPLSTININLELLREDWHHDGGPLASRSIRKIDVLLQESRRLEGMLTEFIRLTSTAELDPSIVDINVLLEDVLDFTAAECRNRNIQITSQLDRSLPRVELDPNLIRQVVLNLLKNSFEAMEERGGTITVNTRRKAAGSDSELRVVIEVIDNGSGITPESQKRVFQAYFSTKAEGTGLGLPSVQKIVERHGGRISCESAPGLGTRFVVELPARQPSAPAPDEGP
ncbi:MAG: ATP-binding protein [Planctomycetota bacterium]